MNYSNKLNLDRFFFNVQDQVYVIVKNENFPNYYKGSDIDIFCYDNSILVKQILSIANSYLNDGFKVYVFNKEKTHTYIDFFLNDQLEFRFDLYQSLPNYKKVNIKPHYILSVIENAVEVEREYDGSKYFLRIPSIVDDILLRYIEYIEWYQLRPDKVKHLEYITEKINDILRTQFLNKLHCYTAFPDYSCCNIMKKSSWKDGVSKFCLKLKQKSIPEIFASAFRKAKRLGNFFFVYLRMHNFYL